MEAISASIAEIVSATNQLNRIALGASTGAEDPTNSAVDEIAVASAFKANLAVLKTAELMTGALLDLKV